MGLMDKIKTAMRTWLAITPGIERGAIVIEQPLSFDAHVLRNRIWYRGDASEIESYFRQTATDSVSSSRFWAATPDLPIRKIHLDIASQMIDKLAGIVAGDFEGFEIKEKQRNELWNEIAKENKWPDLANDSVAEILCTGDGAYKICIDSSLSKLPIIEFYGADRVTPVTKRGRIQEIIFHTLYSHQARKFRLDEHYGPGYIRSKLYLMETNSERETTLTSIPDTAEVQPEITFTGDILAVYVKAFDSPLWPERGASILSTKSDAFDALDEVISEWWDDYRKGRVKQFLPESMFPRDPDSGKVKRPNGFDDMYVLTKEVMSEDGKVAMQTYAPDIRSEQYLAGYAQALDMSLMGILSPSTLGIDLKKTDNAEAQREKEKATLWTRAKIVVALTDAWPKLVKAALTAADNIKGQTPQETAISVTFGEYASPSFDAQLASMGVAAQWNLLSIEQTIEELYGDSKEDDWKLLEVERIKELRGITTMGAPAPGGPLPAGKPAIGDGGPAVSETAVEAALPEKTSLNGAQMASLLSIVKSVKAGELTSGAAVSLISSALPLTPEQAKAILADSV